jgi:hypothetical protein
MHELYSKLVCLSRAAKVTDTRKGTSLVQNLYFPVNYESVVFYSTDPRGQFWKTF